MGTVDLFKRESVCVSWNSGLDSLAAERNYCAVFVCEICLQQGSAKLSEIISDHS